MMCDDIYTPLAFRLVNFATLVRYDWICFWIPVRYDRYLTICVYVPIRASN